MYVLPQHYIWDLPFNAMVLHSCTQQVPEYQNQGFDFKASCHQHGRYGLMKGLWADSPKIR